MTPSQHIPVGASDTTVEQYIGAGAAGKWPSTWQSGSGDFGTLDVGKIYEIFGASGGELPDADPGEIVGFFAPGGGTLTLTAPMGFQIDGAAQPFVLDMGTRDYLFMQYAEGLGDAWYIMARQSASGGSQPGAARWIGPWTLYEAALQAIQVSSADGGTFTITDDGDTTANIAWDANAAAVQSALNALNAGKWSASGDLASTLNLAAADGFVPVALTVDGAGLTFEGSPGGTVALTTPDPNTIEVELLTQTVGDIIEDILIVVSAAFADGAAHLAIKTDTDEFLSTASAYPNLESLLNGRTSYSGNSDNSGSDAAPTAYGIELAGAAPYPIIPAVCLAPSPLAAYLSASNAITDRAGVAQIYLKVATPAAP